MAGNHRSGVKPKPTALKVLESSFRKDRHGAEVQVPQVWPEPPAWLTAGEIELWNGLKPHCHAWVAASDWPTIWAAVSLMAMLRRNSEARQDGDAGHPLAFLVKSDSDGSPVLEPKENPLWTQHMRLWGALRPFISSLGLSPVDRARMHGAKPDTEAEDKWAGILS